MGSNISLQGGLEDMLYPDNPQREDRAKQLASDSSVFARENAESFARTTNIMKDFSNLLQQQYSLPSNLVDFTISKKSIFQYIPELTGIYGQLNNYDPIIGTGLTFLFSKGLIGEDDVKGYYLIPAYLAFSWAFSGVAISLGMIGIISGSRRDQLRKAIGDLFAERRRVKGDNISVKMLEEKLASLYTSSEQLVKTYSLSSIIEYLNQQVQNIIKQVNPTSSLEESTRYLKAIDSKRESWTNDDPPVDCCTMTSPFTLQEGQQLISDNGRYYVIIQWDGNLVMYDQSNNPFWWSNTVGKGKSPFRLTMQEDGNLVIYDGSNTPIWSSNSQGNESPYHLKMQDDRNLVIYNVNEKPVWASGTFLP